MATIASLSVQLQASPAHFMAGLAKAQSAMLSASTRIAGMAGRVNSAVSDIGSRLAGGDLVGGLYAGMEAAAGLAKKVSMAVGEMAGLPEAGAAGAVAIGGMAAAFGGVVAVLQKTKTLFDEGAEKILQQRAAALTLGESFRETAALALAAGGDTDKMSRAMLRMREVIQSARTGDSGAGGLLGRLRLNPEELAKMGTGQQLESVIKALGTLRDELTKSSVEMGIFGERSALAFGPLLSSGKGLARFREQIERFGHDLGASSNAEMSAMADKVLEAKRAVAQLGLAWGGIKMNLAAGLAPVLAETAKLFSRLGVDAKAVQDFALTGAMALAKAGAAAYDAWKTLEGLWDRLKVGFYEMMAGFDEGLKTLFEQLAKLPDFLGGQINAQLAEDIGREMDRYRKLAEQTRQQMQDRAKEGSAFDRVTDWFNDIKRGMDERKKQVEKQEQATQKYEPMRAPIKLAGAAEFGSQEAYKSIGEFAAGLKADMAAKQLAQAQRIEEAIKHGDTTLKDIRNILKRHGIIKVGKI